MEKSFGLNSKVHRRRDIRPVLMAAGVKNPGPGNYHEDLLRDQLNRTVYYGGFLPVGAQDEIARKSREGRRIKDSILEDPSKGFPGPGAYRTDNELTANTSSKNFYNSFGGSMSHSQ